MPPYNPRGHNRRGALFHSLVLASGFIVGGVIQQVGRKFMPPGAAKGLRYPEAQMKALQL